MDTLIVGAKEVEKCVTEEQMKVILSLSYGGKGGWVTVGVYDRSVHGRGNGT